MHAQTRALVVHRTPTRIRVKIPGRRRQRAYFAALERVLAQHPDILRVHVNPLTASVIIECRKKFDFTAQQRRFLGLEMLESESAPPAHKPPNEGIDAVTDALAFAPVLFKLVVAITTRQVGLQVIELAIDAVAQAARRGARQRSARRQPLLLA